MKVLLLAGEQSGELYASAIRARLAGDEIRGYGDYGFAVGDLAVMGFWPVIRRLPFFLRVAKTMKRAIDEWRPDVIVTIDYPGMNLKLAAYAKAKGVRAVHVVCPQVWAWKKGRIPKIEASVDKICCFFPFEPQYFKSGVAEFTGHPLRDEFSQMRRVSPSAGGKTLAVLPGSRTGEIEKILPVMMRALRRLGGVSAVIPAANPKSRRAIDKVLCGFPDVKVSVRDGGARELLLSADCAVVASGTATLEAALAGCPTVLVYRVGRLLGWFARLVIRDIRHVGLINIIAEKAGVECPMPELLQDDFTEEAVVNHLKPWLDDSSELEKASEKLTKTIRLLESDGDAIGNIVRHIENKKAIGGPLRSGRSD